MKFGEPFRIDQMPRPQIVRREHTELESRTQAITRMVELRKACLNEVIEARYQGEKIPPAAEGFKVLTNAISRVYGS